MTSDSTKKPANPVRSYEVGYGKPPMHTRFKKGVSGNPSGRQKIPQDVKELARGYTRASIQALGEIVQNQKATDAARVSAANSLLDRAWGRPESSSTIHISLDVRVLSRVEILARLAALTHEDDGECIEHDPVPEQLTPPAVP